MKRRLLSLLVCVSLALGMMPAVAHAEENDITRYVALGDSISSGYRLPDKDTQSFVHLFAKDNGFEADDSLATPGLTSDQLLVMLTGEDEAAQAAAEKVATADVVTITIGGNDMLNALYAYLSDAYNEAHPDAPEPMSKERIKEIFMGDDIPAKVELLGFCALKLPGFIASEEVDASIAAYSDNLEQVVARIKELSPDVQILVATQYNPYRYLADSLAGTEHAHLADAIADIFDAGVTKLNAEIIANSADGANYLVANAYDAIAGAEEDPCNASITVTDAGVDFDLDFHPNAYGHALIADTFTVALHPSAVFPDVDPSEWYIDAIDGAYAAGIFGGYDNGLMGPENSLTRAEMAQAMWNAAGRPVADHSVLADYTDVDASAWYADSLAWAVSEGLLLGYESGLMGPDDVLAREQTAVVMMRLAESLAIDTSGRADLTTFLDEDEVSDWAYESFQWAVSAGVVNGMETETGDLGLAPKLACSRAQMAALLTNLEAIG